MSLGERQAVDLSSFVDEAREPIDAPSGDVIHYPFRLGPDDDVGGRRLAGKRIFDIVGAAGGLLFFAPLMLVLFFLVRRDGGPALFRQKRIGRGGVEFDCYKFRSMAPNAQELLQHILETDEERRAEWERDQKFRNDPRITSLGRFLREKSLDELPQLWNVLRGDMSLIGPRPIIAPERAKYGECFAHYASVRPGLTGQWQVSGRNDVSYPERVKLDVDYVTDMSWRRELNIFFKTIRVVFSGAGAR